MKIKCQLDATDEFLLQILLFAQHVSGTIMPIIRSSRVLYKWLLPVVFGAWISSCRYGVELRVVCPVYIYILFLHSELPSHSSTLLSGLRNPANCCYSKHGRQHIYVTRFCVENMKSFKSTHHYR